MSMATIDGAIAPMGYLHIKYDMQIVDGTRHSPHDAVVFPTDDDGTVSFALPQGIRATIELWSKVNGELVAARIVPIPKAEKVMLADLLK